MAWSSVRTLLETWLKASPYPFYNTVNEEQRPIEPIWLTIIYGFDHGNIANYCRDRIENSSFTLVHYGDPGIVWNALMAAVEAMRDYMLAQADPNGKFDILNHSSPIEFTGGDGAPFYGVEVIYTYSLMP